MIDEEFERAAVSWLARRGYLVQKLEPVDVEIEGVKVEAFKPPSNLENPHIPGTAEHAYVESLETPPNRSLSRFDEFWQLYPRKTGKEAARKIFDKCEPYVQRNIIHGLQVHLDAQAFSDEKCYIKHPSTWLNQKVYLDDPEPRNWRKPQVGGETPKRKALDDWLSE